MYQPKLSNTQKYEDSQGSHIVTTGKLILLYTEDVIGTTCVVEVNGKTARPYIISETEEIEKGDRIYCPEGFSSTNINDKGIIINLNDINIVPFNALNKSDLVYKVLALPEHFSDKHLQAIVDGKIKDGDIVYLKVEAI